MPAQFSAEEILDITRGRLASGMMPDGLGAICTDTRALAEGDWYLALSGERFDGNDFLGDAFSRGAIGCIVSERGSYPIASTTFPLIAVPDTLQSLHDLARNWRKRINPVVVGITGSSGKTTTKEMCAAAFGSAVRTHKSRMNENNEFGVPKTILSMPDDTQALILEMAMRGLGQIELLARTALPDIGIIVNVGAAHLGILESLDNIVQAKCELFACLDPKRGVAIIGQPSDALLGRSKQVFAGETIVFGSDSIGEVAVTPETTVFTVNSRVPVIARSLGGRAGSPETDTAGDVDFQVRAHGLAHLQDAWCAVVAARVAGLADPGIAEGLRGYEPVSGRGNRIVGDKGALIVDETYNANPDSVRISVSAFLDDRAFPQTIKYVVLGDLAELGDEAEQLHRMLGNWLSQRRLSGLVTVGRLARLIAEGAQGASFEIISCQDQKEAEAFLRARLEPNAGVLIKGSHAANLDRLVARLVAPSVPGGV